MLLRRLRRWYFAGRSWTGSSLLDCDEVGRSGQCGYNVYCIIYSFSSLYFLSIILSNVAPSKGLLLGTLSSLVVPNRTGSVTTTIPSSVDRNDNSTNQHRI
jgi:hypothetical protein